MAISLVPLYLHAMVIVSQVRPSHFAINACLPPSIDLSDTHYPSLDGIAIDYYCPAGTSYGDQYQCPDNSTSLIGSKMLTNCTCIRGYTKSLRDISCVECSLAAFASMNDPARDSVHDNITTCTGTFVHRPLLICCMYRTHASSFLS